MMFTAVDFLKIFIIVANYFPSSEGAACTGGCERACSYDCRQRYTTVCADVLSGFRCTRHRTISCYKCCDGWTGELSGSSGCNSPICFGQTNKCPNGGTCSRPDYCSNCNQGYYSPRCNACTSISNCPEIQCSTSSDQTCIRCEGDFGPANGAAYQKSDDQRSCIKQCSWRSDSNACYPGTCMNGHCTCSRGFTGADCRTSASEAPVLSEYRATLIKGTTTLEAPVSQGSSATVYTNERDFTLIRVIWKSSYQPTGLPDPKAGGHPYIESVRLGVVSASVSVVVNRAQGGSVSIGSQSCSGAGSRDSPRTDLVTCQSEFSLTSWTPNTGDVLMFEVQAINGGRLRLYNRDESNRILTRYYFGRDTARRATFTFDFVTPDHCADASCRTSMLNAGSDVTSEARVTVTWQSWSDNLSGIKEYELEVRQLSGSHGSQMTEILTSPAVYSGTANSGHTVTLPHVGVYSFVLTVLDNAGNFKHARRFVFFDDNPDDVTIQTDSPLRVITATSKTDYTWVTNLSPAGQTTSVEVVWTNHFINLFHHNQGLLKPVGSYQGGTIENDFDQNYGQRGRSEIPNALGVTQFQVLTDIDHEGGRSIINPSNDNSDHWRNEITNTQVTYDLNLRDGDSLRVWVEARDLASHFVRDSILVHADSSKPVIEDLWLVRNGEVDLAVHNSVDLHEMSVEFWTYDIHSGIRTIQWRLFDALTETQHGQETLPARKITPDTEDCSPPSCMCVPIGDCYATDYAFNPTFSIGAHDYDYVIQLTVTNHAQLFATKNIKLSVDASPPQAGVVHDGIRGGNEVDFQQGQELSAHWEGFFDRESGVKFYRYVFDVTCWNDSVDLKTESLMTRTTNTHTTWTAPSLGQYYVTVIAYNRALEPSDPVCSDGVVIDTSPPELSEIVVNDLRMWPGLAKDSDGRVWFIDERRMKVELTDASDTCRSKATLLNDVSIYPNLMSASNDSATILDADVDCVWISGIEEKFFLRTHKHVTISWIGDDAESSIFDYEVGLSPGPDIVTFTSTSGHPHFVLSHPHISQGSVFELFVTGVNKAQLATSKGVGPIIVDTTPPIFGGRVLVHVQDGYLIAEWGDRDFIDDVDTSLAYQVAIGSSPGGSETQHFQSEKNYKTGPCSSTAFCAAFSLESLNWHLHGDHEYYISVRAENGAGLATVATSSLYRHIVQLPSHGVVLDVAPPGEESVVDLGFADDVDVQTDTTSISARWFGFDHPYLDIDYEIAVGSSDEGSADVSAGFIDVGNATYYRLEGLSLSPLTNYFVTIRATSETGSVSVTSDGVRVIQEGELLNGATVRDGLGCDQDKVTPPPGLFHHSSAPPEPCQDDIAYQSSTSDVSARWTIPDILQPFVTNVFWAVQQEIESIGDNGAALTDWIQVVDYQDLGMAFQHLKAGVNLYDGGHYRSQVKFCHVGVCFHPITTDGFWVLSRPPAVGEFRVTSTEVIQDRTELHVMFQLFVHDYVREDNPQDLMAFYEWSIAEDGNDGALLGQWTQIDNLLVTGLMASFTASYDGKLDHNVCLRLSMRGYNEAGLSSVASTEIVNCDDVTQVVPNIVIDANAYVSLEQNDKWSEPDRNYISSTNSLSAVWPTLRHRVYVWAAVEDTGSDELGSLDNGLQYPCDYPMVKACGNTDQEFLNIPNLSLQHGKRYRVCIHADEVTVNYEVWSETLPSVSSCSDGVVVDTTPPTPGSIWIGWNEHQMYQSSVSEVVLHWETFSDIEEHNLARHHSGIRYYEYAIGSMPGGSDVKDFTRVGITNSAIVHNLRLQNGHKYYATVRATDFVGLSAQATSESVTIDTSPPVVNSNYTLDVGGTFLQSTTSVSASWQNIFSDVESGISYYKWAVGSRAGHADVMAFTRENSESGVTDPSQPLTLKEGHSYFVSVKAINNVGLLTLRSFGAFIVDTSPPLAGSVLDGDPSLAPANHRDRDFQEERSIIRAFWEGFHDPHSALVGYIWRAGTCSGCSDIVPLQHVGLNSYVFAENLNLIPGLTYYVTVTACNAADLCTSVTSDGVLIDDSPPVSGHVYDGSPGNGDISFQSSRTRLSAHWWGFHDPHSGLSHYEWRAGTVPGTSNILPATRIELSESALTFVSNQLPVDADIYVTVRAYNQLSMWSEATSSGFRVDLSPPDVIKSPAVEQTLGMNVKNTQVPRDIIRFSWNFTDPESAIKDQYVSVSTHHNGDINVPPTKIAGSETDHTFIDLTLHEGSRYVVTVVACNHAGLCTEDKAEPILVDGSPPSIGTFAVDTNSAANLERHQLIWLTPTEPDSTSHAGPPPSRHSAWMTWVEDPVTATSSLALAWLGFADLHSGIGHYVITVGRTYGGSELTPNGSFWVDHRTDGMVLDEGIVQTAFVPLEGSITDPIHPYLYVSLWAVNGVGLQSGRYHSTFEPSSSATNEGALVLLRRCSPDTCEGHCSCAPIDMACTSTTGPCSDVTASNPNTAIEVLDVLDLSFDNIDTTIDIDHTPTQRMMAGVWRVIEEKGLNIKWYEWSIGDVSSSVNTPEGVFDPATERFWFDIGQDNHVIIALDDNHKLRNGVKYHLFVRAWYDSSTFAVFRSNGVTPDVTPPKISTIKGTKIKDLSDAISTQDIDYLTDADIVHVSWENVFLDSALSHYQVSLSTHPEGEDIRSFADYTFLPTVSSTRFANLSLQSGHRYYSNVRAFNKAGLHTLKSSDGFVIDTRRPDAGTVFDGIGLHDVEYQNFSMWLSASWHGFVDLESYIDHYEWCVGQTPSPNDDSILPCSDVGVRLSASKSLEQPLIEGLLYYSKVSAVDAAGLRSEVVSSDGFVVDTTPPIPQEFNHFGDNLIKNPSFEEIEEEVTTDGDMLSVHMDTTVSDVNMTNATTPAGQSPNETTEMFSKEYPPVTSEDNVSMSDPTSATSFTTDAMTTLNPVMDLETKMPRYWYVVPGSQFSVIQAGPKITQHGYSFLSLHGSISQTFSTIPGSHYQVIFVASHAVPSHTPLLNQEGRIEVAGLNRVFRLYDRPADSHSKQDLESIQWQQHKFYFTANEDVSTLQISSMGRSNGIVLDDIEIRRVTSGPSSGDGSVEVQTQFIHSWSSIQAKWHFTDPESPIVDYSWAIGTTKGGTQLQTFVSVGTQTDAINTGLNMQHRSYVYVTVMARNAADLIAIATADPVLVDFTPPEIHYVIDGADKDMDFSADDTLLIFSWSASDPESGIKLCQWVVGSEPGLDNILPSSSTPNATSTMNSNLSEAVVEGQHLFVSVTCYNRAGKSSWKASDGVTIVTEPPNASWAFVQITVVSETQYETRDGHQPRKEFVRGSWNGFEDPFGISRYECYISGPNSVQTWIPCGAASETHLDWVGLDLIDDTTYSLSVRAVNYAGLVSEAVDGNFTVESTRPVSGAQGLITSSWMGNGEVDLSWDGLFTSSSSLVYEVSIGSMPGGSDIIQWVETMTTGVQVSPLVTNTDYYLTLTAVNKAGLSQTVTKIINDT